MSVSQPLSIAIYDRFYPLSSTPATSLTELLPLGLQANGLILGGDPRKILYTLYSEEGNGIISNPPTVAHYQAFRERTT
jgi:hypothetical protein